MEKKKLIVNAAVCDTRSVTEEILNSYESIEINAASILVSAKSKELLSRYHVTMNVSDMIEIDEDAGVNVQNGSYEISNGTIMAKPTVLIVNGSLQIEKNSEEALKSFISIIVNGSVTYPSGLQNQLPPLKVNGSTSTYPSDAICLKNKLILDKAFIIKAKKARYFVKNKVVIADETLDISSLVNKGSSFITRRAIIAEALLEDGVHLFEDETDIIVIPAGYRYVQGGNLNELMINKNGNKLYVDGDLIITSDSRNSLSKLAGIRVNGSILIADKLKDRLLDLDAEYNDIKAIKGNIISDKGIIKISKQTLMGKDDGITILDCGMVKLDIDLNPSEIEEKLQFIDCGYISCSPEQRGVIELVSEDVGFISDKGLGGLEELGEEEDTLNLYQENTQVINAASYTM
ncbi:MAG: hypothetical protein GX129_09755 [Clostridiales bacterium]|nr:hypothetical protein [Clostridiales bacterium]